ncbi:MAG: hypothetical protein AAFS10_22055, partial [Myxococcota bacterium]
FCDTEGLCQIIDCPPGAEGCACSGGAEGVCGVDSAGNQMDCAGGICQTTSCVPGMPGCACIRGYGCSAGTECVDALCRPEGCFAGQEFCGCAAGGCLPGLRCQNNTVCVSNTGYAGGACLDNDTCYRGARCVDAQCVSCRLGALGCGCDDNDTCNTGLTCLAGSCIAQEEVNDITPDPTCYSRCNADLTVDDVVIPCDTYGLMEGCFDGKVCVEGTCTEPNGAPRACLGDLDCPDYQSCHGGTCTSECKSNANCPTGMACNRYVCRLTCDALDSPCPEGLYCEIGDDAIHGFCLTEATQDQIAADTGSSSEDPFTLSTDRVEMTNVSVTGTFQITNNSRVYQTFTLKKMSHTVYTANASTADRAVRAQDGEVQNCPQEPCVCMGDNDCGTNFTCQLGACRPQVCVDGACPMFWLGMGEADATVLGQTIEVGIEAGRSLTIELSRADQVEGVRWNGRLEISNGVDSPQNVQIDYTALPEGQWSGEMVYLAQFGTQELETWRQSDDKNNTDLQENIGNALVQRWGAFRRGALSLEEFEAVLRTTLGAGGVAGVGEVAPTHEDVGLHIVDVDQTGTGRLKAAPGRMGVKGQLHAGEACVLQGLVADDAPNHLRWGVFGWSIGVGQPQVHGHRQFDTARGHGDGLDVR